jgi:hypothetical protein
MALSTELVQACTRTLAEAQEGDRLVKAVHDVLALLGKSGHVYTIQLPPHMVGISPLNRDGSGVNPVDVHELLGDIASVGWLEDRVNAIGVEPVSETDLAWNHQFFLAAGGALGSMDTAQLKLLSLAGSHTNCVLRCFACEVPHEGDEKICAQGRLSLECLRQRDEAFHAAVTQGVKWKVITKEAAIQLPQLLSLVQRMGNASLARGEHELQLMRRLHALWVADMATHNSVDFMSIKKRAISGKTVHAKALPHLYSFALKAVGGRTPWLLEETEAFVRSHSPSTRSLGPDLWQRLSADVKGASQFVRFRHALASQ